MLKWAQTNLSRRRLLGGSIATIGASAICSSSATAQEAHGNHGGPTPNADAAASAHRSAHGAMMTVGTVDNARNGFDPTAMLTDWYTRRR